MSGHQVTDPKPGERKKRQAAGISTTRIDKDGQQHRQNQERSSADVSGSTLMIYCDELGKQR